MNTTARKIRIFISSPGDVQQERNIAKSIISDLNQIYSNYATLEVVMWEDFPLTADSTFQEGINFFIEGHSIDIAIFILWARLGTPLCSKFLKPDGTPYNSGTEYEFELMMKLHHQTGVPKIMAYIKNCKIKPTDDATLEDLIEAKKQEILVKDFISEHFRDEETNSNYAYCQYGDHASFEDKLRTHLTEIIKYLIGDVGEMREWDGNPYVGLKSYDYHQNKIFYGRRQLVYNTASKLLNIDDNHLNSLIVLGESGSGKSSFVKAGLLPFLCKSIDEQTTITPSMFGGDVYNGLLRLLADKYKFIKESPFYEELKTEIDEFSNFKHLTYVFEQNSSIRHILFIDQFEELFSSPLISNQERQKVILLLRGLISTGQIPIFIAMRSDFYNRFSLYAEMAQIKDLCVVIDMPIIGYAEITDIVEEPARKACLKWEIDNYGNSLNKVVIKDAAEIHNLPLIEFALSELYERKNANDCLTFEAYKNIGKLEGAIITYAENFYSSLDAEEKIAFNNILGFVITESSSHKGAYVRKTSLRVEVEGNDIYKKLISKLINCHLFISDIDSNGNPTITITHEILINHWEVIKSWIENEKEFLEANTYYSQREQYWNTNGKLHQDLISGRSPILKAEYHLFRHGDKLSKGVKTYLTASINNESRKGLWWRIMYLIIVIVVYIPNNAFNTTSLPPFLGLTIAFIFLQSIVLKICKKPVYESNKFSIISWIIITTLGLALSYTSSLNSFGKTFFIIYPTITLCNHIVEGIRRKKWSRRFYSYYVSDSIYDNIRSILTVISYMIVAACLSLVIMDSMRVLWTEGR